ncbi:MULTISPECIES: glycosyltransferase family 2 protein [Citrobacter]|uniref:glycosyltransferase family 2 protein n=1 Tax=Citrobacter TaxID=544 RepID=UPI000FFB0813|nr:MULTISPECIES: glycosyltransferase [Citrobacter]MDM2795289.1 glycosyltransferase [Citrobacter sp. Cpo114]MDM2831398.1 glycosyltransferase [Citrobacter sp. Cpo085]
MIIKENPDLVTVIMPVYNAEEYLSEAITSILDQSYKNIEFIIINDGSTDSSDSIIKGFLEDKRIHYISRSNKGLVYSLNEGLDIAKGMYIARMDADDISHPQRIEKQVEFMLENDQVAVVGCSSYIINFESKIIGQRNPPTSAFLNKALLLFGPTLSHPTVMFNRSVIGDDLYYCDDFKHAEDFELWLRLSNKYNMGNLPEKLFSYRINESGVSQSNYREQKKNAADVYCNLKHPGNNDKKLVKMVEVIQLKDKYPKVQVIKALSYILVKYELDIMSLIKIGYILRWLIK